MNPDLLPEITGDVLIIFFFCTFSTNPHYLPPLNLWCSQVQAQTHNKINEDRGDVIIISLTTSKR